MPGDGKRLTATNGRDTSSTKGNGATTPHDHNAETNLQKDPRGGDRPPPQKKNDCDTMAKGGKGQKKRSASNGGNTVNKSHKWSSAEGDDNKNKDAGTNGAPGDGERLTATNGCDTSSTKKKAQPCHMIAAMQRRMNRKMQVQYHSRFSKRQFGTLE